MGRYVSAETSQRHAFLEHTVEEVLDTLGTTSVQEMLGPNAETHADCIARMYIPNYRNGRVVAPNEYKITDHIPLFATRHDEELELDPTLAGTSPTQEKAISRLFKRWFDDSTDIWRTIGDLDTALEESELPNTLQRTSLPDILGFISRAEVRLIIETGSQNEDSRIVMTCIGRPAVALVMDETIPQVASNISLVHEAQHVLQSEARPVVHASTLESVSRARQQQRFSNELKAYQVGAYYSAGLEGMPGRKYPPSIYTSAQWKVEDLRANIAHPHRPYYPSIRLRLALASAGLDIMHDDLAA
jgi:hypothetical protein